MVSLYAWAVQTGKKTMPFSEWLDSLDPRSDWLKYELALEGKTYSVFHVESLANDVAALAWPELRPVGNRYGYECSAVTRPSYDQSTADTVYSFCKPQFDLFGYAQDSWK